MIKKKSEKGYIDYEKITPNLEFETSEGKRYWMANITSNLYDMFSWSMDIDDWKKAVHNKKGSVALKIFEKAIKKMIEHRVEALKYNSPNLWGTYPNAFRFLCTCAIACAEYPDYYFYVSF
jgi:hypothetical protein